MQEGDSRRNKLQNKVSRSARAFHPFFLYLYIMPELLARSISTLGMRSLACHLKNLGASQTFQGRLAKTRVHARKPSRPGCFAAKLLKY